MFEKGAQNFAFLSRSGTTKPEAASVVGSLRAAGANVQVFCVDASDEKSVAEVVDGLSQEQPIKGVIHAAMVLRDGLYQNMTFSAYEAALRPKMNGAIALDKALGNTPLDFFLMTSSISAVLGNPGQANYCAGNSYLDFLALRRRRQGLAACSIALPMVEDVGVVAENSNIAESLARKMPFGIDEKEMLSAFEAAIIQGQAKPSETEVTLGDVQLILGLEPEAMVQAMEIAGMDISDAFWYRDARMLSVRVKLDAISAAASDTDMANGGQHASGGFVTRLTGLALPEDEMLAAIGVHIVGRTSRILGMQPEKFKLEGMSVANHGLDSMISIELQRWLFTEFGLQTNVQVLSNPNTTFNGLARMVAEHARLL